jgi:hypothetical protein
MMNYHATGDVSARIGALELGAINAWDDGALEASTTVSAGPTRVGMPGCLPFADEQLEAAAYAGPAPRPTGGIKLPGGGCIDDGVFEETVQAGPNAQVTLLRNSRRGCEFVEVQDDVLENAATFTVTAGPTAGYQTPSCHFIDDGALEATMQANPMTMRPPMCFPHIDDGALEAMVMSPTDMSKAMGCMPISKALNCIPPHHIDDAALETAVSVAVGPTSNPGFPGCHFADDTALEASVAMMGPPPAPTMSLSCLTRVNCGPRIDDGALEGTTFTAANSTIQRSPHTFCMG